MITHKIHIINLYSTRINTFSKTNARTYANAIEMNSIIHDEIGSSTACLTTSCEHLATLGAIIEALAIPYDEYRAPKILPNIAAAEIISVSISRLAIVTYRFEPVSR